MNNEYEIECCLNIIKSLCNELDYLASPDIEIKAVCSLDCCIGNSWVREYFIERYDNSEEMRSIIGIEEFNLMQQLEKFMKDSDFYLYDDEKGFSKTQRWLDFVTMVNTVNTHLKDAVKKYQSIHQK